ncbi:MAG: hypothetical protein J6P87_07085 [Lachnospiraceae bacterium]|nr:hypothetical protein [Lachnospiraceae bacterium]
MKIRYVITGILAAAVGVLAAIQPAAYVRAADPAPEARAVRRASDEKKDEEKTAAGENDKSSKVVFATVYRGAEEDISADGETDVFTDYEEILLTNASKTAWPALWETIAELNRSEDRYYSDEMEKLSVIFNKGEYSAADLPLYSASRFYVRRNDGHAFSILEVCEFSVQGGYTGYAHYSYNIDPLTGSLIYMRDVVRDMGRFFDVLTALITTGYPQEDAARFAEELRANYIEGGPDTSLSWTFDPLGITVFIAVPEGISIDRTVMEIYFPYDEMPELFSDRFVKQEGSYCVELSDGGFLYPDLFSDGEYDEIIVAQDPGPDANGLVYVSMNGVIYEEYVGTEDIRSCYVKTDDGGDLLIITSRMPLGDSYFDVYDISSGELEWVGGITAETFLPADSREELLDILEDWKENDSADSQDDIIMHICDPDRTGLAVEKDVAGRIRFSSPVSIGGGGEIYQLADCFYLNDDPVWTVKTPFRVSKLDKAGGREKGIALLQEGTKLIPVYTDGFSWIDAAAEDGQCFRIWIQQDETGLFRYIDGIEVCDALDGTLY